MGRFFSLKSSQEQVELGEDNLALAAGVTNQLEKGSGRNALELCAGLRHGSSLDLEDILANEPDDEPGGQAVE